MKTVNALMVRNEFGKVLELLESDGQPVVVNKGGKPRAVLITPEDFQTRFVDKVGEDRVREVLARMREVRARSISGEDCVKVLRRLRGYKS